LPEYSKARPPEWFDVSRYSEIHKYSNTALITNLEARAFLYFLIKSKSVYEDGTPKISTWFLDIFESFLESPIILNFKIFRNPHFIVALTELYRVSPSSQWLNDEDETHFAKLSNTFVSSLSGQDIDDLHGFKSKISSLSGTGLITRLLGNRRIFDIEKAKYSRDNQIINHQPESLYLKVDITASKSKLMKQFEDWVDEAKVQFGDTSKHNEIRNTYYDRIRKYNLLAYQDIYLWMKLNEIELDDNIIAEWITPHESFTVKLSRHKELALSALKIHFVRALERLESES